MLFELCTHVKIKLNPVSAIGANLRTDLDLLHKPGSNALQQARLADGIELNGEASL